LAGDASGSGTALVRTDPPATPGGGGGDDSISPPDDQDFDWLEFFWLARDTPGTELSVAMQEASWQATAEVKVPLAEHLMASRLASWRDDSPSQQPDEPERAGSPRPPGPQSWNRACEAFFADEVLRTDSLKECPIHLYSADGMSCAEDRLLAPTALVLLLANGSSDQRRRKETTAGQTR
jgi:hypothetical protein